MPKKLKILISTVAAVLIMSTIFSVGCIVGSDVSLTGANGMDVVQQVWSLLFKEYVQPENLDAEKLSDGAINGIMDALNDPYSAYLNKESYSLSISSIQGHFEGIGAYVGIRNDQITIIAPITDSPADKAGIKAGDVLLAINGESTDGLSLNDAVLQIRGPEGTSVTITILHQGEDTPVDLTITREQIQLSSVYHEMMDDISYIRISNFSERTNDELTPVLNDMDENNATGIILDLRSNPGGLLTTVVDVTSRFLHDGYVLYSRDNQGNKESYKVVNSGEKTDLPIVILTDNYTASASEVLSGALQDYDRAVVAGTVTYGKGSVNTLFTLDNGAGIYITTHRWLTPNGREIEGKGITPDYPDIPDDQLIDWATNYLHELTGSTN